MRISRLTDATFYALAVLEDGAEVDARPSDALTLALLTGAPILVEEAVLETAARHAGVYAEELAALEEPEADARALAQETRERLAALERDVAEHAARVREAEAEADARLGSPLASRRQHLLGDVLRRARAGQGGRRPGHGGRGRRGRRAARPPRGRGARP